MENCQNALVADDSSIVRKFIGLSLRTLNIDILEAQNGLEALEVFSRAHIQLVITDLQMPRMDGFDFIRKMKSDNELARIPVIVLSSIENEFIRGNCQKLKTTRLLIKPFQAKELREAVIEIFNRPGGLS